jgi:undecaprenyl diphosphate synthase
MSHSTTLPQHIAIIMDGNRRWAKQNKFQVFQGHEKVAQETIERLTDHCLKLGIPYLTLWVFSTENWKRDQREVDALLMLMRRMFDKGCESMIKKKVKIETIGDLSRFPLDIQQSIQRLKDSCVEDYKITVTLALNYGGRDEICRAVQKYHKTGLANSPATLEDGLGNYLDTSFLPDPDLIIRTGGEQRLSGFMPWQSVYAELYFTQTLMPDFNEEGLDEAIAEYQQRDRRFGS